MKKVDLNKLALAIKKKRENEGLSLRQLSKQLGMSSSVLNRVENSTTNLMENNYMHICNWLGKSAESFMISEKVYLRKYPTEVKTEKNETDS